MEKTKQETESSTTDVTEVGSATWRGQGRRSFIEGVESELDLKNGQTETPGEEEKKEEGRGGGESILSKGNSTDKCVKTGMTMCI
jgi:hypothetical protein